MADRISEIGLDLSGGELVIFVDGEDLLQRIDAVEESYKAQESKRFSQGLSHRGLTSEDILAEVDGLLGYSLSEVYLYGCAYYDTIGCWPIGVRIERTPDTITWSRMANFHREEWDYGEIGNLHLRAGQYKQAWQSIAPVALERQFQSTKDVLDRMLSGSGIEAYHMEEPLESRRQRTRDHAWRSLTQFEHFAAALDLTRADIEPYTREIDRLAFPEESA